tara:strand:+ start:4472 stop:5008 length:537 start_codon:yes stop_codon:yes gene_type:complete
MTCICVFSGSRTGNDPVYEVVASELGKAIAMRGLTLVFGGGKIGLMGAVAQSALQHGGDVVGIIPEFLASENVLHQGLTKTILVKDMFKRKAEMIALSDAYIALPGGIGTLDELLEVIALGQLDQIQTPIGVLDTAGYFEPWFKALSHSVAQGFVDARDVDCILRSDHPDELLDLLSL